MERGPRIAWRAGLALSASVLALWACSGGGDGGGSPPPPPASPPPAASPPPPPAAPASVYDAPAAESLGVGDVERVLAQAIREAEAQGVSGVIAVVDRVGNVLAVFKMTGATDTVTIRSGPGTDVGLQGVEVPRTLAAISKALTGAYLSSAGNAFTTRTANMIVQEHFPPAPGTTTGLESGPLFGVQFSQLPCSDLNTRAGQGVVDTIGPKRAPLGLAADPGGMPLYKNGVVVGGIGVMADDDYGFDPNVLDTDTDVEELIAVAGGAGFEPPSEIRAERVSVDGTTLRYADAETGDLATVPANAPSFASLDGSSGQLVAVTGYYGAGFTTVLPGQTYGAEASGLRPATTAEFSHPDAFVLSDGVGNNRFPVRAGGDGARVSTPLTETEVRAILEEAFGVMASARGQIRRPLDSRAQVTISLVDTDGRVLGVVRAPDAPIFGTDVSLQKARTASFFSSPFAADDLSGAVQSPALGGGPDSEVRGYVQAVRDFLDAPDALTGTHAFADRSGGNLSRPYFPDGQVGTPNGPLSRPITEWSVFATGLQADLIFGNLIEHVSFVTGAAAADTDVGCSFIPDVPAAGRNRLHNGIQIFPGSVPVYRDGELVGGLGVSGDGIDQDDMISFLGVHRAGERTGTINNADPAIRADQIVVQVGDDSVRLRYVNCPFAPFLDSDEQNVCQGK